MTDEAEITKQVSPEMAQKSAQRARDRVKAARWDLDVAIFLFAVLIIIIVLLFQGIGILGILKNIATSMEQTPAL